MLSLCVGATIKRCLLMGWQRRRIGDVQCTVGDFWFYAVKRLNKQVAAGVSWNSHPGLIKDAAMQSRLIFVHIA